MKIKCSLCKKYKELSEFYKQKERLFGVNGYCKPCRKEADKERRLKKKECVIRAF